MVLLPNLLLGYAISALLLRYLVRYAVEKQYVPPAHPTPPISPPISAHHLHSAGLSMGGMHGQGLTREYN